MPSPCITSPSCGAKISRARNGSGCSQRGSALVIVLLLVTLLSVIAGGLLLTTSARYHTTFQSASWQESIVGAEAGIDLAMNELRKRVTLGAGTAFTTNWTTQTPGGSPYSDYGHAFPDDNQAYTLSTHTGEGNSAMQARVYLDVPGSGATPAANFAVPPDNSTSTFISQLDNPALRDADGVDRSRWWYRIRALGTAGLSGPPVANLQKLDNQLRRFSFFTDWRTGRAVASPQVSRLVEITARPLTHFRNALMADKRIDLSNQDVLVDSYDSSKGGYNASTNHGTMGNVATNGQLINAGHATVNGDAMTNNGAVQAGDKVSGQQSNNFYQELPPVTKGMLNPAWSGVPNDGTVTGNAAYTASADSTNPTLVRLDGINLPAGGSVLSVNAPDGAGTTDPSFIKIYVQGDVTTSGDSYISFDSRVNAIVFFTGSVNLQGNGIFNNSMLASHLVLNGLRPQANPDGTFPARDVSIATYQDFEGIVYAPNHDLKLALQAVAASSSSGVVAPVTGAVSGTTTTVTKDVAKTLDKLQKDLTKAQDDLAKARDKYQKDQANSAGTGSLKSDQADIDKKQAAVTQIQTQIDNLQGKLTAAQADDHARGYNGIYGTFVARTITVANKTHIHYDETLRQAGPVNHYQIVSWFEDNISRDAAGSAEQFWWPVAASK